MDKENNLHRKRFLQLSARMALGLAGILGLGGLARYFSYRMGSTKPDRVDLGPAGDFPDSGRLILPDVPAVIYKTVGGFRAYSLICTHLGCTVEEDGENFSCPCHGSVFDAEGLVLQSPAVERLPELRIELTEQGSLILETGKGWQ